MRQSRREGPDVAHAALHASSQCCRPARQGTPHNQVPHCHAGQAPWLHDPASGGAGPCTALQVFPPISRRPSPRPSPPPSLALFPKRSAGPPSVTLQPAPLGVRSSHRTAPDPAGRCGGGRAKGVRDSTCAPRASAASRPRSASPKGLQTRLGRGEPTQGETGGGRQLLALAAATPSHPTAHSSRQLLPSGCHQRIPGAWVTPQIVWIDHRRDASQQEPQLGIRSHQPHVSIAWEGGSHASRQIFPLDGWRSHAGTAGQRGRRRRRKQLRQRRLGWRGRCRAARVGPCGGLGAVRQGGPAGDGVSLQGGPTGALLTTRSRSLHEHQNIRFLLKFLASQLAHAEGHQKVIPELHG